jgi:glucosamine--fructose-6-phosphate aminotransferase (isomerizing)
LLAIYFAKIKKKMDADRSKRLLVSLKQLPGMIQQILNSKELIRKHAQRFSNAKDFFFLGRSLNYPVALEGALKLKEISYIHAEGYAAGELKHGPLALISKDTPVVALATRAYTYDKMLNNIKEVKARAAPVIAIAGADDTEIEKYVDAVIRVPATDELLYPVLSSVVVQLLAYYTASALGCPIDKPRNLAKSVTVE